MRKRQVLRIPTPAAALRSRPLIFLVGRLRMSRLQSLWTRCRRDDAATGLATSQSLGNLNFSHVFSGKTKIWVSYRIHLRTPLQTHHINASGTEDGGFESIALFTNAADVPNVMSNKFNAVVNTPTDHNPTSQRDAKHVTYFMPTCAKCRISTPEPSIVLWISNSNLCFSLLYIHSFWYSMSLMYTISTAACLKALTYLHFNVSTKSVAQSNTCVRCVISGSSSAGLSRTCYCHWELKNTSATLVDIELKQDRLQELEIPQSCVNVLTHSFRIGILSDLWNAFCFTSLDCSVVKDTRLGWYHTFKSPSQRNFQPYTLETECKIGTGHGRHLPLSLYSSQIE